MCDSSGSNNSIWTSMIIFITSNCNSLVLGTTQNNVSCFGASDGSIDLSVSGGSGTYTYSWSDGSSTEDLTGLSAGTYSVSVTDVIWSCVETISVIITEPVSAFSISIMSAGSATVCGIGCIIIYDYLCISF